MKAALGTFIMLFVTIIAVALTFACVSKENLVRGDISSYIDRAQVSANASDMAGYITQARVGMEKYGMTEGHAALLWKRPDNDMSLIYAAVLSLEDRAILHGDLYDQDLSYAESTTYQVALDDLRGSLRELEMQDLSYYWRHGGLSLLVVVWLFWVFGMAFGLGALVLGWYLESN